MKKRFTAIVFALLIPFAMILTGCLDGEKFDITLSQVENVDIDSSRTEAKRGEEITLSYDNLEIGYEFKYFTINGLKLDENKFTMPQKDVEISAVVEKINYTITYHIDNDTMFENNQTPTTTYTIGSNIELVDATRAGSVFKGWFKDEGLTQEIESITQEMHENLDLYPKFDVVSYTITYHYDGEVVNNNPSSYNLSASDIILNDPVKQDYEFKGWYDNSTFSGEKITKISANTIGAVNLYAKFVCTKIDNEGYRLITNEIDFLEIIKADYTGKYRLTNSLDFSGYTYTPIGSHNDPFKGELDGNNKLIMGIKIEDFDRYCGLFGYMLSAKISNLNLLHFDFDLEAQDYTKKSIGALAGRAEGCEIENIELDYAKIVVSAPYASVGSLIGYAHSNTQIVGCEINHYATDVSCVYVWGNTINVGGLCGELTTSASINKCYVKYNGTGKVFAGANIDTQIATKIYCGGLVGYANLGRISNSFVRQSKDSGVSLQLYSLPYYATSESAVGGLVGYLDTNSSLEDCYGEIKSVVGGYATGNAQYPLEMSVGGLIGKMLNVYRVKNLFIIAPNDGGYRDLTMYNDAKLDCGYIVGEKGSDDQIVNCYAEKDMIINLSNSNIYDLDLVDKTKTYNEFKTLLGWDSEIWYFSQSVYALPTLK